MSGAATDAGERALAGRDAAAHLQAVRLPSGAVQVRSEPRGDHGYLRPERLIEASFASAVRHAWWRIPQTTTGAVLAYVLHHRPAGARQTGTSGAGDLRTGTSASGVMFQWPRRARVLGDRLLVLTATNLPAGATGVLVETQTVWIVQRPAGERVPSGVQALTVTSGRPGRAPEHSLQITDAQEISRITALADALPAAQPGSTNCPAETDPRRIVVTFVPGARLTLTVFRPWTEPAGPCGAFVTFTVHGVRQAPLEAGSFVGSLQRVLGRKLVP